MFLNLLMVMNVVSALLLVLVILLQRSDDGLGSAFGGGGSASIMGADSAKNVLTRATGFLATVFILSCLAIGYFSVGTTGSESLLESLPAQTEEVQPAQPAELIPALPSELEGGVLDN